MHHARERALKGEAVQLERPPQRVEDVLLDDGEAAVLVDSGHCVHAPQTVALLEAALAAGWEFMGHGFVQRPMHQLDDQRAACEQLATPLGQHPTLFPKHYCSQFHPKYNPNAGEQAKAAKPLAGLSNNPNGFVGEDAFVESIWGSLEAH